MRALMRPTTTWRKAIGDELTARNESWADVVTSTLTEQQLDAEFDCSFGSAEGEPFTLWTHRRVYFPVVYDGSEWVGSVPRNPCDEASKHVGGQ